MSCFGAILGGFFVRPLMNLRDFSQKSARKFCKKRKSFWIYLRKIIFYQFRYFREFSTWAGTKILHKIMRQNRSRKRHLSEFEKNASANIFAIFNENCFCGNAFSQVLCNCFGVPENVAFVTLANDGKIAIWLQKADCVFIIVPAIKRQNAVPAKLG